MEVKSKDNQGCYFYTALSAIPTILLFEWLWPNVIPFTFFEFWRWDIDWGQVFVVSWPMLLWGTGATACMAFTTRNAPEVNKVAEKNLASGIINSSIAGIFEEISFRWLIYYGQIITYSVLNFILFGFLGFGIFEWFFLHVSGPLANFTTLGFLSPYLFSPLGWVVGGAIITSNGSFRDGHFKNGWVGFVNSWFIGMYLFYIMFQHGLVAAIFIHFLYDLLIYLVIYYDAVIERSIGSRVQVVEKNKKH